MNKQEAKADAGKPRFTLVPRGIIRAVAAIYFSMLGDTWENLRAALDALRTEDPGTADKFIGAVMDQLSDIAGELNEMEGDS